MAAMEVLTMSANGGLIPHAWHDGKGVFWLAVAGSKLAGTGFEKPQIGQIQVALMSLAGAGDGAIERGVDTPEGKRASLGEAYCGTGLLIAKDARFDGFGNSVILGDDLRKPA